MDALCDNIHILCRYLFHIFIVFHFESLFFAFNVIIYYESRDPFLV
jgi:hypothetical protein